MPIALNGMEIGSKKLTIQKPQKHVPYSLPDPVVLKILEYNLMNDIRNINNTDGRKYVAHLFEAVRYAKRLDKTLYGLITQITRSEEFQNHLVNYASNTIEYHHTSTFNEHKEYKRILSIAYLGIPRLFEQLKDVLAKASLYSIYLLFDGKFFHFHGSKNGQSFRQVMAKFPFKTQGYCARQLEKRDMLP